MTHRERVLAAVHHQPVDRIPTDMWATPEVQEMLFDHFNISAGKESKTDTIGLLGGYLSRGVEALLELWDKQVTKDGILYTEWGFGYKAIDYGRGVYDEQVVFPLDGRAVSCGYLAVFTFHQYLRGLELNLTDPMMMPEFTQVLIQKITDFYLEYLERCFIAGKGRIDFTQVTDDWGSQKGLLSSIDIFNDFYRTAMQRGIDLAKSYNINVFHHDDGDCRQLIPTLVDMGIDNILALYHSIS